MISVILVFWSYVILFAIIGAIRGWTKELLVSFSVMLGLAVNHVFRRYIPVVSSLAELDPILFWARIVGMGIFVIMGYLAVSRISVPDSETKIPAGLQNTILGTLIGTLNGYLITGTILYYLHIADYLSSPLFISPSQNAQIGNSITQMMLYMPPQLLGEPGIYFAVIVCFVFVIVVFV